MAVASEVSSAQLNPATQPNQGVGGHFDSNLLLRPVGTVISATSTSTAIDVEGGELAEWLIELTANVGASATIDAVLQVSRDGGSTYVTIAMFRQFVAADIYDATVATQTGAFAKAVWLPRPTGTNKLLKVREVYTFGGATSFTVTSSLRDFGYGQDRALNNL